MANYENQIKSAVEKYEALAPTLEMLAKKYGVKKQMISGVHFNFSFDDDVLKKLQRISGYAGSFQNSQKRRSV